ncbi:hypothetical protein OG470_30055 [Micromonospora sp. NBC_00389]
MSMPDLHRHHSEGNLQMTLTAIIDLVALSAFDTGDVYEETAL